MCNSNRLFYIMYSSFQIVYAASSNLRARRFPDNISHRSPSVTACRESRDEPGSRLEGIMSMSDVDVVAPGTSILIPSHSSSL